MDAFFSLYVINMTLMPSLNFCLILLIMFDFTYYNSAMIAITLINHRHLKLMASLNFCLILLIITLL